MSITVTCCRTPEYTTRALSNDTRSQESSCYQLPSEFSVIDNYKTFIRVLCKSLFFLKIPFDIFSLYVTPNMGGAGLEGEPKIGVCVCMFIYLGADQMS